MAPNYALERSVTALSGRAAGGGRLSRLRRAGRAQRGPLNADVRHLQVHAFEGIARPVILGEEGSSFPYWGKGTSFLLADSRHYFWITAEHVIRNMGGSAKQLRIYPDDNSKISLPFTEKTTIKREGLEDEEFKDLFLLRINLEEFSEFGDAPLVAQDAEAGLMPAEALAQGSELWIIGYPAEISCIDYESQRIKSTRSVIRAIYHGYSASEHCHTAKVQSSIHLSSFDGISGSPVFYMQDAQAESDDIQFPMIVGMLLRGTAESSIVHFLSARIISEVVRSASADA